ncbi:abortive infection family protein [Macrococcus brunensis]|uniref:abortive infection family protein n=1 Tax=Macrococcus brunensis TaxID=198483 RepID=UPI001EEFAD44|nr:abortive infection family protein [Macrococcus brunensis]ULG74236.1 abortive infection family protein [Macrococcus brunensis]
MNKVPINDEIIIALANAVDDSHISTARRDPSHSQIDFLVNRFNLKENDPRQNGQNVGKKKRIYTILSSSIDSPNEESAEKFMFSLINEIRGLGGFRKDSLNYIGSNAIMNLTEALKNQGYILNSNGTITNSILDNISEIEKEKALMGYVNRAKKGQQDAALIVGTSKDLLEAVALHVLVKKYNYDKNTYLNFPTLLGQAFTALGLCTNENEIKEADKAIVARKKVEASLYSLGCSINNYRNKVGSGHGRPFIPEIKEEEAKLSIEIMGIISELMLTKLKED